MTTPSENQGREVRPIPGLRPRRARNRPDLVTDRAIRPFWVQIGGVFGVVHEYDEVRARLAGAHQIRRWRNLYPPLMIADYLVREASPADLERWAAVLEQHRLGPDGCRAAGDVELVLF